MQIYMRHNDEWAELVGQDPFTTKISDTVKKVAFDDVQDFINTMPLLAKHYPQLEAIEINERSVPKNLASLSQSTITFSSVKSIDFGETEFENSADFFEIIKHFYPLPETIKLDKCVFKDETDKAIIMRCLNKNDFVDIGEDDEEEEDVNVVLSSKNLSSALIGGSLIEGLDREEAKCCSNDPEKVFLFTQSLKLSDNSNLKCLIINDADLQNVDFKDIQLPGLEKLDLKNCMISWDNLKHIMQAVPQLKLPNIQTNGLQVWCKTEEEERELWQKIKGKEWPSDSMIVKVSENPIKAIDYEVMSDDSLCAGGQSSFDTAYHFFIKSLPTASPLIKSKVVVEKTLNLSTLTYDGEKVLTCTTTEVRGYSGLAHSGLSLRQQAQLLLKGLGFENVDPDDVQSDSDIPVLDQITINTTRRDDLAKEIKTLITELQTAKNNTLNLKS